MGKHSVGSHMAECVSLQAGGRSLVRDDQHARDVQRMLTTAEWRVRLVAEAGGASGSATYFDRLVYRVRELWQRPSFRHVTLPATAGAILIGLFFSGNSALASIVVPELNRELGLLEHFQLLPIAAVAVLAFQARRNEAHRLWRAAFMVATAGAAFVFLEEINYGQHYLALIIGRGSEAELGPMSVHNLSDTTDIMKLSGDAGMALILVLVPVASRFLERPLLGMYTPSAWYVASMLIMLAAGQLSQELSAAGMGPGWLRYNVSEFRELFIYYIGALYARDVAHARAAVAARALGGSSEDTASRLRKAA